ncbi:unnamed protein product, partial [Vitis vinifera]
MENNSRGDIMDLDLNLEPLDPPHDSMLGLGSLLTEIETAHGRIEERIRQLEAVNSRARQRQRWRQGRIPPQTTTISTEPMQVNSIEGMEPICFFDCNICLDMARDPILTCCGHLFCWPCFYQLPNVHSNVKECPECNGEVIETHITPIYGHGSNNHKVATGDLGVKAPPRPHAHRIESMRQQRVARGIPSFPSEETLRIISSQISRQQARTTTERSNVLPSQNSTSQVPPGSEAEPSQGLRSVQFSRLLSQGTASFSSLSSALNTALNSAERLVEDLEEYIHSHLTRSHASSAVNERETLTTIAAVLQLESQALSTGVNTTVPPSSSSSRTDVSAIAMRSEDQVTDSTEINISVPHSSSSRRRNDAPGASDMETGDTRHCFVGVRKTKADVE